MNLFHMVVPGIGVTLAPCYGHGISCQPQACDLDVTGTPCQDFAPNGHRLGVHGPQWSVCLAWISLMLLHQVPVIVHENVPQFLVEAMALHMQHQYVIYTFLVDCASIGFRLISRKRRFTIMYHKTKTEVMCNPCWLYERLSETMLQALPMMAFNVQDCFLADLQEICKDIEQLYFTRGIAMTQAMHNMALLLSPSEQSHLAVYLQKWIQRFGTPACMCPWAVFNLSDNPGAGYTTWSAASMRIPGLRTHNAKYWVPWLGRWLTNKELLACMGLPVYPVLAEAAGVCLVHVNPGSDARHMVGNMMHVAAVGSVMAVAMACCIIR